MWLEKTDHSLIGSYGLLQGIRSSMAGGRPEGVNGPVANWQYPGRRDEITCRVLRKIDTRLIPLLFMTYMLNFMDKTILSSASVFGLKEDTGLKGQEYSWVSSVFYLGYFIWTYPTTVLIARLPIGKYLGMNTLFWGTAVTLTAACTDFRGLVVVRFLLGVAEATITPAFVFLTSTWYTREEMPSRTGIWFSGNSFGGMLASLFAFGIGHVHDGIGPWRWMFIILGVVTFLWGFVLLTLLPDSISDAGFLTKEERQVAARRVVVSGTGPTEHTHWRRAQVLECLVDPKTWFIFGLEILTQIPNGGTQNFANLVIKSFGFTSLQSTLINIPYSILSAGMIAGTGHLAGRFHQANCSLIVVAVIPCMLGSALIYSREQFPQSMQLLGYFMLSSGPSAMPLALSLVQTNYRGVTKKMTMTALLFLGYCAGNMAGPELFREDEAPLYLTAFRAIVVCYGLVILLAVGLRCYLKWMNTRRDRIEASSVPENRDDDDNDDDLTDWKTRGFRYRY
ncbi:Major facilitator superfamily domain containing protein [Naviculisporaceae sp. PSN 640]